MGDFIRIRPQDMPKHMAGKPHDGWRLVVRRAEGENAELIEEQVLPECVNKPNAQAVLDDRGGSWLTIAEVRWLRDVLSELLVEMEADHG